MRSEKIQRNTNVERPRDSPFQIHIQQVQQDIPPLLVPIPTYAVQEVGDPDIAPDHGIVGPLGTEVDDPAGRVHEDVLAHDPGRLGLGQLFTG